MAEIKLESLQGYIPWIITACCAVGVIVLLIIVLRRQKKTVDTDGQSVSTDVTAVDRTTDMIENTAPAELTVKFEDLPALTEEKEKRLVEVRDKKLLARIDNVIPGVFQTIANTGAIHNYRQAVQNAGQLYRAVIPKGAVLTNSRSMKGAVRGFYRNAKNIRGHANLVAVDSDMGKGLASMGAVNAVMGVASMVVGQYYMTQINNKLDTISNDIKKIDELLDNEFKGKIYALVAEVQKCSTFQVEILESDELRLRELDHLKNLEHECAELLGHANLMLMSFTDKNDLNYDDYEKAVANANKWFHYQQILLAVMGQISELTYALNLGAVSKDYCYAMYGPYAKQAADSLNALNEWHRSNTKRLEIDTDSTRRKRQGIEGFFMSIPAAVFNQNWNYKGISENTAKMIDQQIHANAVTAPDIKTDYFQEDVELIAKDGKLYYLTPGENAEAPQDK